MGWRAIISKSSSVVYIPLSGMLHSSLMLKACVQAHVVSGGVPDEQMADDPK